MGKLCIDEVTILETNWNQGGQEARAPTGFVGPEHVYKDVFGAMANMIAGGMDVDYAQFASGDGFRAMLQRFVSNKKSKNLIVGGHGGHTKIHAPAGSFDLYDALEHCVDQDAKKHGLIIASCRLGRSTAKISALLEARRFRWVAAYRVEADQFFGPVTELLFWRALTKGWKYRVGDEKARALKRRDPIGAGILAKLEYAGAVAQRFDVRVAEDAGVVSSLEVFAELVALTGVSDERLVGVRPSPASREAAVRYRDMFELVRTQQWQNQAR